MEFLIRLTYTYSEIKKYICEKIETEIKDDSIDPVHVGYFYMMA